MKMINRGVLINNYYRELVGIQDIYQGLDDLEHQKKDYHSIIPTIMYCHNSTIQKGTGYSPNQLRINNEILSLLDVNLKIKTLKHINKENYVKNKVIDYSKFKRLMQSQQSTITITQNIII